MDSGYSSTRHSTDDYDVRTIMVYAVSHVFDIRKGRINNPYVCMIYNSRKRVLSLKERLNSALRKRRKQLMASHVVAAPAHRAADSPKSGGLCRCEKNKTKNIFGDIIIASFLRDCSRDHVL